MFSESDGPTALRADLVSALSLSLDVVEISGKGGPGRFCAALGSVWNGKKGYVAVLLRQVNRPFLRRFVFDQVIDTREVLAQAVDEGIAFVESMGFTMDHPEFEALSAAEQERRVEIWNDIRKTKRKLRHVPADGPARSGAVPPETKPRRAKRPKSPAEEDVDASGPDPFEGWDIEAHETTPVPELESASRPEDLDDSEDGKAVLGKLSLVRRTDDEHERLEALARLLSYF